MSAALDHAVGRRLERLEHDPDTPEWVFRFDESVALRVSAPWRVVVDSVNQLGWCDDGHQFGLPARVDAVSRLRALIGEGRVVAASSPKCGDLILQFDSGAVLEIFVDSCGYEGWQLSGPGDRWVVGHGGGVFESGA